MEVTEMATKWQKQVKAQLGASVADRVICHADGSVTARRTFFYTFGGTSSAYLDMVQSTLKAAGIQTFGESNTRRADWPNDSYWQARVWERTNA